MENITLTNLEIKDYNQTFCQMHRLSGEKELKSTTYTKYILPILERVNVLIQTN